MAYAEDVANLLEYAEAEAQKQFEDYKKSNTNDGNGDNDIAMGDTYAQDDPEPRLAPELNTARDPLRLDRPDFVVSGNPNKNRYKEERDENDERRTRRSHDQGDDDAANGASDKDSANGTGRMTGRGPTRSRSPGRPGSRGSNGSSYRTRDTGRRDPFYREDPNHWRPRYSSRDRGPRGGRRRSSDRGDHGRYDGGRRDDRDGPRTRRSPPGGRGKRKTPEPTDDERDRRTVFVQQLAARLRTKKLKEFFENGAGPVVEAQIVKDRVSGRSKGVGYVEFRSEESVQKAIALTGQKLESIPVIVQLTEAEKNRVAKTSEGGATQSNGVPFHRLYVGNIHFSITEDDLKDVFEPFGELEFVQLQKEEQGRSKGYGFVQFVDPTQAKEALEKMNGFDLAGRPIRVGLGNDKFTPESTQSLLQRFNNQNQGSSFSGMGGRGAHAGGSGYLDRPTGRDVDKTGGASALDDTDVGGVNFNNFNRNDLMQKLMRRDAPEEKTTTKTTKQSKPAIAEQAPTRCVLLKHAYSQANMTDPDWKETLKTEIKDECDQRYGTVVHIDLTLDNDDGEVYVKFDSIAGGKAAVQGLNGRWFDGQQITAQYVVDAVYNMNFPKAQKV
ncbi:hypothetical protein PRZ48_002816 [Zasmidium cellare]|uniref:RRM domain-containing protein n=1 Tax=Zasmidium cellare TaxID=395010 RepID=A0ABR0EUU5_ZASCE|nr:hypothetical protein PRZ48_002816 [Zasmidium cellare]